MTVLPFVPAPDQQAHVFRKALPLQVRLQEVMRALGAKEGLMGLEFGSDNGVYSKQLRKRGGTWQTVVWREDAADSIGQVLGEKVQRYSDGGLPFEKKLFDVVVVTDFLERFVDDVAFIEECHKVLKPDGRLVVGVHRIGTWRPVDVLRQLLGLTYQKQGFVRPGYTESELFGVLKSGFDVHVVRAYSRFFVELTDAIVARAVERLSTGAEDSGRRLARLYTIAGIFYRLAFQLDLVLFFSRGYRFMAVAKRRAWRPRNAPVLVDGRSITEAVLSRAPA